MVGLESHNMYLNHHGRVHTPLPGPAIITEKGVEQGQVIGLYFTGGINDRQVRNIGLDWSGVGGVQKTAPGVEDKIKYVTEVGELPRWSHRRWEYQEKEREKEQWYGGGDDRQTGRGECTLGQHMDILQTQWLLKIAANGSKSRPWAEF